MSKTSYSIFEIADLGIDTVPFEEFLDMDQLQEDKSYIIGVLDGVRLINDKICYTLEEQEQHIEELYRIHGDDAYIMLQEHAVGSVVCVFSLNKDHLEIEGDITDKQRTTVETWAKILAKDYSFHRDLAGIVIADEEGELLLKSIY